MGSCFSSLLKICFGGDQHDGYSRVENDDHDVEVNIQNGNSYQNQRIENKNTETTTPVSKFNELDATPTSIGNGSGKIEISPYKSPVTPMEIPKSNGTSVTPPPSSSKTGFYLKYELKESVGVGSTSTCHRCIRKSDGKEFACKIIDKGEIEEKFTGLLDQFYVEIKALQTLNHPNIIHLEDVFETSSKIYMVMEMMRGGELFDYVVEKGTLSEEEASAFVRKITSAVSSMHNMNIIHRDLKPENLLLTTKEKGAEVKLIDFGLAKIIPSDSSGSASSFLGTKGYLAPEMLQRHSYDKAIDMWALGIIVFVLLCGCLPFDDDSSKIPSESAARKKFTLRFPRWSTNLSASAKDLLHNLLDVNPKTRFTAEQALSHPWVSGKTVVPNNYLQSPTILGERRNKNAPSPTSTRMAAMHSKLLQANAACAGDAATSTKSRDTREEKKGESNLMRKQSF